MERKSIGSFIAALRKANGMTQKDLADRLYVSDKTISRWERDDGYPDLGVIPVLAEIFGVTCDEILRGERIPFGICTPDIKTDKGEKEKQRILDNSSFYFRIMSISASAVAFIGFGAGLISNSVFHKGLLGSILGSVLIVLAALFEAIMLTYILQSAKEYGDDVDSKVHAFRWKTARTAERAYFVIAFFLGTVFPFSLGGSDMGLTGESFLLYGPASGILLLFLSSIVAFAINGRLTKKGWIVLPEKEGKIFCYRRRIKVAITGITAIALLVTFLVGVRMTTIWGPGSIAGGTTFTDYESFIEYMERDVQSTQDLQAPSQIAWDGEVTYYDKNRNAIDEETARTRTIKDDKGNVILSYKQNNDDVMSISYSIKDGSALPITVRTYQDIRLAEAKASARKSMFCLIGLFEVVVAFIVYFLKRK